MTQVPADRETGPLAIVFALGTAPTIAWASSYYLPAILAAPIARDLGLAPTYVFGALSGALVISGLLGPRVGHAIDTFGGRGLLAVSNLVFVAGLLLLSVAHGVVVLVAAWVLLGIGMGMGLYEAAFATLARIYGSNARRTITGITLIAGFASTLGWPLTTWLAAEYDWRVACQVWAAIHICLALTLNLSLPRAVPLDQQPRPDPGASQRSGRQSETFAMVLLAYMFAAASFVSSGVSAILPTMLVAFGATPARSVSSAVVGPARHADESDRRGCFGRGRPLARIDFHGAVWRRQRHHHHCPRHASFGTVRAGGLRPARRNDLAAVAGDRRARPARARSDGGAVWQQRALDQRAGLDLRVFRASVAACRPDKIGTEGRRAFGV